MLFLPEAYPRKIFFDFHPERLCWMVPAAGFNPVEQTIKMLSWSPLQSKMTFRLQEPNAPFNNATSRGLRREP